MRLQIMSDLHCEHMRRDTRLATAPHPLWNQIQPYPDVDVAVVAGDIDTRRYEATVSDIAANFKHVVCLLGNHEFYHRDISWRPDPSKMPDNVHVLDRGTVKIDDVTFIGCTLWSDFKHADKKVIELADRCINDFKVIKNGADKRFTAQDACEIHVEERKWLIDAIRFTEGKKVIVTHFMPSHGCVHPKWKTDKTTRQLNHYFAANCDELLRLGAELDAKLWINGHTHDEYDKVMYGEIGRAHV